MKHSDALDKIAPALVAAQKAVSPAHKTASNPHFRSNYATLGDVWDAAQKPLADNGLAVTQGVEDADDSGFTLVSTLWHTSGQWISEGVRIPLEKATAQSAGSGITYGRRYGLTSLLGIVADDDDDGNAASGKTVTHASAPVVPISSVKAQSTPTAKPNGQPPKARSAVPSCPTCGGEMYDNRAKKASGEFKPKSPDFTCKDKECKNEKGYRSGAWVKDDEVVTAMAAPHNVPNHGAGFDHDPDFGPDDDPLPF